MKPRKLELGDGNIIGKRVTEARLAQGMKQVELLAKLQLAGIDISVPALSLLEKFGLEFQYGENVVTWVSLLFFA